MRGNAPAIDLELLQHELHSALQALLHGDFMQRHVPEGVRRFNDIALSGNGEPTTSHEFSDVIRIIAASRASFGLDESVKTVLITNGSQLHKPVIQASLSEMSNLNGEVWYKLDRVPDGTLSVVNQVALTRSAVLRHLIAASQVCRTWVQTCMFELDGWLPSEQEITDYLELVQAAKVAGGKLEGVLLYGLARASTQPEAPRLGRAPEAWMRSLAQRIESLGLAVRLSP
ncbi:hypothetical protein [Parachitinimonas caeni]|uniref:Radical SAM protein n=1 Tax=Parachitinimonas caeni TaxID=3031301 RepID=A0ABT7E3W8_9NEIS|nr:hypothetical protein [Parachitinimonas caeni]MDK2126100.1 hypothetical protein [Parachitinimonas caeni]